MTLDELKAALGSPEPPTGLAAAVVALWYDGRGDWEAAHRVAQDIDDETGAWVHAYLHRKRATLTMRRTGIVAPASLSLAIRWRPSGSGSDRPC